MGSQSKDKISNLIKNNLANIRKIMGDNIDTSEADRILEEERKRIEDRDNAVTFEVVADDSLSTFD